MLFRTLLLACLATAEALTVAKIWKEYVADRIAGRNDTEASRANASLSIARHHGARRTSVPYLWGTSLWPEYYNV